MEEKRKEIHTKIDGVFVRRVDVYNGAMRRQYIFGFAAKANLGVAWSQKNVGTVYAARERSGKLEETSFDKSEFGGMKANAFKAAMSWVVENDSNATNETGKI